MQKRYLLLSLVGVLLVAALIGIPLAIGESETTASGDSGPTRIMISGDSITQGSGGDWTWRYRLWTHLQSAGADVEFVGPYEKLHDRPKNPIDGSRRYRDRNFDKDHNAMWGRALAQAADSIGPDVAAYKPDVLLVLLGINDLLWTKKAPEVVAQSMRDYIANARSSNPELKLVIAEALPTLRTTKEADLAASLAEYNVRLNTVAEQLSTDKSPVIAVDIADSENFTVAEDTYDGTHPNARGELKIAAAFADALAEHFSIGRPYRRPLPEVELGPQGTPELTVTELDSGKIKLSWTPVAGATSYWVWVKRPETDWTRLPYPLPHKMNPWIKPVEIPGPREYRIQPRKGHLIGEFSNTVTYTG